MNSQPCLIRPTNIDLNPDELHYYRFIISLDSRDGGCNTVKDTFDKICAPIKIEDVNLKVLSMIIGNICIKYLFQNRNGIMISVILHVKANKTSRVLGSWHMCS